MMTNVVRVSGFFCKFLKKNFHTSAFRLENVYGNEDVQLEEELIKPDREYEEFQRSFFGNIVGHNCFIIHPYVKWGPKKKRDITPEEQLEEAVSLINTLDPWRVAGTTIIPLDSLDKKELFGSGTLTKLKEKVHGSKTISAVFVNVSTLRNIQMRELENAFHVPILDRYRVVLQILKLHAISSHAKLQVALAEIYYLKAKLQFADSNLVVSDNLEKRKLMLHSREKMLKSAIEKLHQQRELRRSRRKDRDYPVVAVVGYTNSGKTSLIKALTGEKSLQPRNQLFATLDVTIHAGLLPCTLEVLYVDTVGFISDIPTNLIECFVATLEDALVADLIVHVEDISSTNVLFQRKHVLQTLTALGQSTKVNDVLDKIITASNKCDLIQSFNDDNDALFISAKTGFGIDVLRQVIEGMILKRTDRKRLTLKVLSGGEEMSWLYKNSAVISSEAHPTSSEHQNIKVIITNSKLQQFKKLFL